MQTLPGGKIKIPVVKIFALVAKLVKSCKDGISPDEAADLLSDFLEIFSKVLVENLPE